MKRIGILTFHRSINYGAYMQSYALSNEIQKRFPATKVEIIDFELLTKHENYRKGLKLNRFPLNFEYYFKYRAFQKDLANLPLSSRTFITNNYTSLIEYTKKNYDILVVGSDAVWAYQKMSLDNPYWLFGEKLKGVVKMSYAASAYSTDFKNIPTGDITFIQNQIKDFQYIGVRDTETYNFIKEMLPYKKIHLNNDPTFFLKKIEDQQKTNKILRNNFVSTSMPIISFMTRKLPHIEEIKKYLGNKYTFIHFSHRDKHIDIISKNTRLLFNLSPIEWYNMYSRCTLNISQYFHGTLLGIRNGVPTFSIDDTNFNYKYIGKNEQVMTDLKLNDYFFYTNELRSKSEEKTRFFSQIDFAIANFETEQIRLEHAANEEMKKSESFFTALKTYL